MSRCLFVLVKMGQQSCTQANVTTEDSNQTAEQENN